MTRESAINLLKKEIENNKTPEEIMTFLETTLDMVRYTTVRDGAQIGWSADKVIGANHDYDHAYGTYRRNGKYLEFGHKGPYFTLPTAFNYDYATLRIYYNANLSYPIYGTIEVPGWSK